MTAAALDIRTDQLPDLDAAVACECPHHEGGCPDEATRLTWDMPCGHEQEALCQACTQDVVALVRDEDCGVVVVCDSCDSPVSDIGIRQL